jgi:hypothetical protein
VHLDTQPSGATIEVDGKSIGTTPLTITTFAPGSKVEYTIKKQGYLKGAGTVEVPGPGKEVRMVHPLTISDELARIKIVSEPLGAQVVQNGQVLAGVQTPAEVLVEAGKVQRFTVTMQGYVPTNIEPFTPTRGAVGVVKTAKLTPGHALRIESTHEGRLFINGASHCKELTLPAECTVASGNYSIELTVQGSTFTKQAKVGTKPVTEKFELGTVEAPDGKQLMVNGKNVKKAVFEPGTRNVMVADDAGVMKMVSVKVKAGATVTAR